MVHVSSIIQCIQDGFLSPFDKSSVELSWYVGMAWILGVIGVGSLGASFLIPAPTIRGVILGGVISALSMMLQHLLYISVIALLLTLSRWRKIGRLIVVLVVSLIAIIGYVTMLGSASSLSFNVLSIHGVSTASIGLLLILLWLTVTLGVGSRMETYAALLSTVTSAYIPVTVYILIGKILSMAALTSPFRQYLLFAETTLSLIASVHFLILLSVDLHKEHGRKWFRGATIALLTVLITDSVFYVM